MSGSIAKIEDHPEFSKLSAAPETGWSKLIRLLEAIDGAKQWLSDLERERDILIEQLDALEAQASASLQTSANDSMEGQEKNDQSF